MEWAAFPRHRIIPIHLESPCAWFSTPSLLVRETPGDNDFPEVWIYYFSLSIV